MSPADDIDADALLADAAREAHAAMLESRQRMKAAGSAEDYERYDRAFHRECRNLRQTLALRDKLKRDADTRAETAREASRTVDNDRADVIRDLTLQQATRLVWDEAERNDWTRALVGGMERFIEDLPDRELLTTQFDDMLVRVLAEAGADSDPAAAADNAERRRWAEALVARHRAAGPKPPDPDSS